MSKKITGIRRRFFLHSLAKYMLMFLVPLLLLGSVIGWVVGSQTPSLVSKYSESLFEVSSLGLDTLFKELHQPQIFIEANADVHLALLQYFQGQPLDIRAEQNLTKLSQYLETTRITRNYIHSLYLVKPGCANIIVNGERLRFEQLADTSWIEGLKSGDNASFYIFNRQMRSLGTREGIPVTTLIYVTKYHELIIVNLYQSFFSNFLQSLTQHDSEAVWLSDAQGTILSENWEASKIPAAFRFKAFKGSGANTKFENAYQLTKRELDNQALILYSLIPLAVLHGNSNIVFQITFVAILLAIIVSLIFSLVFTKRSYQQIMDILNLFESDIPYENDLQVSGNPRDPFYYILQEVISLYVNQAHLRTDILTNSYQLIRARMAALQYQINPHFIFNTLQVIDMQISRDIDQPLLANRMIQDFSRLLRYSLEDPSSLVTLQQEINMTRVFLRLLQYRDSKALQVHWHYDEDHIKDVQSLRMVFQPLIENILSHAVSRSNREKPVSVRLRIVNRGGEYINCSIVDNGLGVSEDRLQQIRKSIDRQNFEAKDQVGLANVNTRLRLSFGDYYALRVYSRPGKGFAIFFKLPRERSEIN